MILHAAARHAICSASCNWHNTLTYFRHAGLAGVAGIILLIAVALFAGSVVSARGKKGASR